MKEKAYNLTDARIVMQYWKRTPKSTWTPLSPR